MAKLKCKKITTKNYKKCGYDHYYKIGKKQKFTIDTPDGHEEIYNSKGKYEGEFS